MRNLISGLATFFKCKVVIHSEVTDKAYAEGDFLFCVLFPPFLSLPSSMNVYNCFVLV